MLDSFLGSTTGTVTLSEILICTAVSLVLGIIVAFVYMYRNNYSKNLVVTIALLPAMIQSVIMVVNGNLGAGVAVMGAFSLVRFRSVPGSAKDLAIIFFSMATGLAVGMGYVIYAVVFTVIISVMLLIFATLGFGERNGTLKTLKVTIPEDLDYSGLFDDLFKEYTSSSSLDKVKTTNLGSLYELCYTVTIKDAQREKELLDKIRQRNGNLNISCARPASEKNEL